MRLSASSSGSARTAPEAAAISTATASGCRSAVHSGTVSRQTNSESRNQVSQRGSSSEKGASRPSSAMPTRLYSTWKTR
ncbi:hypothetical protein [Kitasatospora sp. DSM 101779]|uniref:hypothetical protein n=1 Tax=Kitasatospora sp. DSM 101779 TaxID=2853165 RepID=UPI0021DA6521|nr:hypothetical protein [Kitasatospora sp. DSM 101779]MCU7823144.1 hypothetical protein [Kitasatospora sp. DSM 101779]